jgi:predicted DNA-binding transcriptional regulator AlpA
VSTSQANRIESFITGPDVQALIGVSRSTLARYVRLGLPRHRGAGKSAPRYLASEVQEWMRGGSAGSRSTASTTPTKENQS